MVSAHLHASVAGARHCSHSCQLCAACAERCPRRKGSRALSKLRGVSWVQALPYDRLGQASTCKRKQLQMEHLRRAGFGLKGLQSWRTISSATVRDPPAIHPASRVDRERSMHQGRDSTAALSRRDYDAQLARLGCLSVGDTSRRRTLRTVRQDSQHGKSVRRGMPFATRSLLVPRRMSFHGRTGTLRTSQPLRLHRPSARTSLRCTVLRAPSRDAPRSAAPSTV
jgi:hypothetical protein